MARQTFRTSERIGYWENGDWFLQPFEPEKYFFDDDMADRWVAFFEEFCFHVKGTLQGQPFVLMDWLRQLTRELHGWRCRSGTKVISLPGSTVRAAAEEDSFRRYQEGDIWVPKKNSKTFWAECMGLGCLLMDGEKGAEAYSIAADEEQARVGFEMAQSQITFKHPSGKSNPLSDYFTAWQDRITLNADPDNTWFKVISGSPTGKMGPNVHFVHCDEIHGIPDPTAVKHMKKGMIARRNPLFMQTSHFGEKMEGYGYTQYKKTIQILEGKVKRDRVLVCSYEFPEERRDQWRDKSLWHIPNPGYGISINPDRMEEEYHDIEDKQDENNFQIYYLNIWCGTDESVPFSMADWNACYEPFTIEDLYKSHCGYAIGGGDLAAEQDMTAGVVLTATRETEDDTIYRVFPDFYLPKKCLLDEKLKLKYDPWVASKELTLAGDIVTDYGAFRRRMKAHKDGFPHGTMKVMALDRRFANETSTNMAALDQFEVVHVPQTFPSLAGATKRFIELVLERKIRHNGNAILAHNVQNLRLRKNPQDSTQRMPSKRFSNGKIDGVAALINALSRAILLPPPPKPSVYETRGVLRF